MMNAKQLELGAVLVSFSGLTVYALETMGVVGLFDALMANVGTVLLSIDLVIALTLVLVWMRRDAKAQQIRVLPYVLLTLAFGSVGPLAYLIHRAGREHGRATASARASFAA